MVCEHPSPLTLRRWPRGYFRNECWTSGCTAHGAFPCTHPLMPKSAAKNVFQVFRVTRPGFEPKLLASEALALYPMQCCINAFESC